MTGTSSHSILLIGDQIRDAYFRHGMLLHCLLRSRKTVSVCIVFFFLPFSQCIMDCVRITFGSSWNDSTVKLNREKTTPLAQEAAVVQNKHTLPVLGRHTSTHQTNINHNVSAWCDDIIHNVWMNSPVRVCVFVCPSHYIPIKKFNCVCTLIIVCVCVIAITRKHIVSHSIQRDPCNAAIAVLTN